MTHRLSDNLLWLYFQKRIRIGGQNKEWTVLFLLKCTLFTYLSIFHTLGRYKRWTSFNFQHLGSENYPDSSIQNRKPPSLCHSIFSFQTLVFPQYFSHFDVYILIVYLLSDLLFPPSLSPFLNVSSVGQEYLFTAASHSLPLPISSNSGQHIVCIP